MLLKAIKRLRLRSRSIDLLIQDIYRKPKDKCDGDEFYKFLKDDPQLKSIPVLFCTGGPDSSVLASIQKEINAFADGVLRKPFHAEELLGAVKTMLIRHKKFSPNGLRIDSPKV